MPHHPATRQPEAASTYINIPRHHPETSTQDSSESHNITVCQCESARYPPQTPSQGIHQRHQPTTAASRKTSLEQLLQMPCTALRGTHSRKHHNKFHQKTTPRHNRIAKPSILLHQVAHLLQCQLYNCREAYCLSYSHTSQVQSYQPIAGLWGQLGTQLPDTDQPPARLVCQSTSFQFTTSHVSHQRMCCDTHHSKLHHC